ncbi:MAG: peptidoglycan editing factor PgeF [Rhodospirillales bacterium]|nr:peptidoglycan editing factor PgeF [Rhodospirillales bacterium]
MIANEELDRLPGLAHGFFTRAGGVSDGHFASLNCGFGSGDDLDNVAENRRRVLGLLGAPDAQLITAYQQHTNTAIEVDAPWAPQDPPIADAMATRRRGVALGILSADCAPVLMVDSDAGIIGAAHAGWRGALDGITDSLVDLMERMGAKADNITAVIGPCIAQISYEVGPEFYDRFHGNDLANDKFFDPSAQDGHWMFDLSGYVALRLESRSVGRTSQMGLDTCAEDQPFFSYRRATLLGEKQYGRAISAIMLID